MYGYIYMTTNLVNGKKYIGKHKGTEFTTTYKGSGKIIREAFKKYGFSNFDVKLLECCDTEELLNKQERYWIAKYNACFDDNFYNISNGGEGFGGLLGDKNSAKRLDVREKMSKNHADISGDKNPSFGGLSEEHKKKVSETRKRLGIARGKNNPNYGNHKLAGSIIINNGNKSIMIKPEEFSRYAELGFVKGRILSAKQCHINKGNCWVNNTVKEKHIKYEELDYYLLNGWIRGRLPYKEEYRIKNSISHQGQKLGYRWMHKDNKRLQVLPKDIELKLSEGYEFGFKLV